MCVGLSLGRSTPRIRGTNYLLASSLALFVAGIGANDEQPPLAADHFTVLTYPFYAGSHFHRQPLAALAGLSRLKGNYFFINPGDFEQGGKRFRAPYGMPRASSA